MVHQMESAVDMGSTAYNMTGRLFYSVRTTPEGQQVVQRLPRK